MNILFLTVVEFDNIDEAGIYTDLLREFVRKGHKVYVVSPVERKYGKPTGLIKKNNNNCSILKVKILNIQKTNVVEKGLSTLTITSCFIRGIKKYLSDVKFDLVLYSTPPITLAGVVEDVKKRDGAKTYLLLKDIFPQNAVDIGMLTTGGLKGLLYKYFHNVEKKFYAISDKIGCMSPANAEFLLKHNPEVSPDKVEVCPNSVEPLDMRVGAEERISIRQKYQLPVDKKIFIYGGNLGKPQGIDFMLKALKSQCDNEDAFFLVVGTGTEYGKIERFVEEYKPANLRLMKGLLKEDYDKLVAACDVGMIFLDHRFTIPNFPSRLLSYMQARLPVLCCTDPNTDVGKIAEQNDFGWWCESNDVAAFGNVVQQALKADLAQMGENGWKYLLQEYTVEKGYQIIMRSVNALDG